MISKCKLRIYTFNGKKITIPRWNDKYICKCTLKSCRGVYDGWKQIKQHSMASDVRWDWNRYIEGFDKAPKVPSATEVVPDSQEVEPKEVESTAPYEAFFPPDAPYSDENEAKDKQTEQKTGNTEGSKKPVEDGKADSAKTDVADKGAVAKKNTRKDKGKGKAEGSKKSLLSQYLEGNTDKASKLAGKKDSAKVEVKTSAAEAKGTVSSRKGVEIEDVTDEESDVEPIEDVGEGQRAETEDVLGEESDVELIEDVGERQRAETEGVLGEESDVELIEDVSDMADAEDVIMAGSRHVSPTERLMGPEIEIVPELQSACLYFQKELKLFICSHCWTLHPSPTAIGHVKAHFPNRRAPMTQAAFKAVADRLNAADDYPNYVGKTVLAIPGLKLYKEALLCGMRRCGYIAGTGGSMRLHYAEHHKHVDLPRKWRIVTAQHFNNNTHRTYFRVTPRAVKQRQPVDKWAWIKDLDEAISTIVEPPSLHTEDPRNVSAWLKHTRWPEHAKDHDAKFLRSLVAPPQKGEFPGLRTSIVYLMDVVEKCFSLTPPFLLRRIKTKDLAAAKSHMAFVKLQTKSSWKEYTNELVNFVAFLLRDKGSYKLPLPDNISVLVEKVRNTTATDEWPTPSPDSKFDSYTAGVFDLLLAVWTRRWVPHWANIIGDPTICFVALSSIREDGQWAKPDYVTPLIAKMHYLMRSMFLIHINLGAKSNADFIAARHDELEKWFHEGHNSTFDELASLSHYGSAIVHSTPKLPDFIWLDEEKTEFVWKGTKAKVSGLKDLAMEVKRKMHKLWKEKVLCGLDIDVSYDHIADDLDNQEPYYSFASDSRNKYICDPDLLIKRILEDPKLAREFVNGWQEGEPIWNLSRLIQWCLDYSEFLELLLVSIELTGGSPSRGTEMTCLLFRNMTTRERNIFIYGKVMTIVGQYSKTTANTGEDKWLPHGLDGFDHDFVVQALFLAHPFALKAITTLKPNRPDITQLWYTHLFVNFDKPFTTEDMSSLLARLSLSTMGLKLTIRPLRQVAAAVRRAKGPTFESILGWDAIDYGALQAGHTRATEDKHYGITSAFLKGLPEDLFPPYIKVSERWQELLGIPITGRPIAWHKIPHPDDWIPRDHVSEPPQLSKDEGSDKFDFEYYPEMPVGQREWDDDLEDSYADVPSKEEFLPADVRDPDAVEEEVAAQGYSDGTRESSVEMAGDLMVVEQYDTEASFPGQRDKSPVFGTVGAASPASEVIMSPREQQALAHLRSFLRDSSATWSSPEQRRATMAAIYRKSDVMAIFPTGGGKSIIPIVANSVRNMIMSIISPYCALLDDWKRRLEDAGFTVVVYKTWMVQFPPCNFVLATTDMAVTPEFSAAVRRAVASKRMDQLVLDEMHEVATAQSWRECMRKVWEIRVNPIQFIGLSATLPHTLETLLVSELHLLPDTEIIRASTNRPELQYILEPQETKRATLMSRLDNIVKAETLGFMSSDRGLIFVHENRDGEDLAALLKCDFYSSTVGLTAERKKEMVEDWRNGVNRIMVCTSAFAAGYDYPCVRFVAIFATPFEMITALQEMGRAGRDRRAARCYILPQQKRRPVDDPNDPWDVKGKLAIYEMIYETDECIRLCLTRYVDENGVECKSSTNNVKCSRCGDKGIIPRARQQTKTVQLPPRHEGKHAPRPNPRSTSHASSSSSSTRPPPNAPAWGKKTAAPKDKPAASKERILHRLSDLRMPVPPGMQPFDAAEYRYGQSLRGPAAGKVLVPNSSPATTESIAPFTSQSWGGPARSSDRGQKRGRDEEDTGDVFEERAEQVRRVRVVMQLEEEEYIAQLKRALRRLEGKCTVCMVMEDERREQHRHKTSYCPDLGFKAYLDWKKHVRYRNDVHGNICACCHVPQIDDDLHRFISQGTNAFHECPYPDSTLPLVYAIYRHEPTRLLAQQFYHVRWDDEFHYAEWLCAHDVPRSRTNTMSIFLWFIERCWSRRRS
ncbi:hypothetical protein NP233_g7519 [Leucocoprinus birnbaumii]|uniref:DNA 3'-5' helicase n=1 Tax=Leucocoprinus birnbaumii TaxID=56174 RepID=A0AAD5VP87_9AGAR|nr:hypothetical protein NP233_g7519 [Leucocoprinus birnbaumii]